MKTQTTTTATESPTPNESAYFAALRNPEIKIDNHCTDLYISGTGAAELAQTVTPPGALFFDEDDNAWYDLAFAYLPAWIDAHPTRMQIEAIRREMRAHRVAVKWSERGPRQMERAFDPKSAPFRGMSEEDAKERDRRAKETRQAIARQMNHDDPTKLYDIVRHIFTLADLQRLIGEYQSSGPRCIWSRPYHSFDQSDYDEETGKIEEWNRRIFDLVTAYAYVLGADKAETSQDPRYWTIQLTWHEGTPEERIISF